MQSCAVGEHEGKVELTIRKNDVAIVAVEETDQGSIQMRSLKSIVEDEGIKHIDALKIDIEGYEDKALAPFLPQCVGCYARNGLSSSTSVALTTPIAQPLLSNTAIAWMADRETTLST